MNKTNKNKYTQWKRMCRLFIDSALEIVEEEGLEKLTIRKIADRSAYNSATLYNYFENLDEIKFYAVLKNMDPYLKELGNMDLEGLNSLEIYIEIWITFMRNASAYPEYYYIIFFKDRLKSRKKMWEKYLELYSVEALSINSWMDEMLSNSNIYKRSKVLMDNVVKDGFIEEDQARIIDEIVVKLFHSLTRDRRDDDIGEDEAVNLFKKYIGYLLPIEN